MNHILMNIQSDVSNRKMDIAMIDHIAIAYLLEQIHGTRDHCSAAAEDAFYRTTGHSTLERLVTRLLSLRMRRWGTGSHAPTRQERGRPPGQRRCGMADLEP
jgi:hypothetical protein